MVKFNDSSNPVNTSAKKCGICEYRAPDLSVPKKSTFGSCDASESFFETQFARILQSLHNLLERNGCRMKKSVTALEPTAKENLKESEGAALEKKKESRQTV